MKKIILTLMLSAAAIVSYGQGYVVLGNSSASLVTTNGGNIRTSGGFLFEVFIGAPAAYTAADDSSLITMGLISGNSGSSSGRIISSAATAVPSGLSFPTSVGSQIAFQVRGWSTSLGATWAAAKLAVDGGASTGYWGRSSIGLWTLPSNIPTPPVLLKGLVADPVGSVLPGGFELVPVPEPSVIALGVLGLGGLLFLRRRK